MPTTTTLDSAPFLQLQHVSYEEQLKLKSDSVVSAFEGHGLNIRDVLVPILPSPSQYECTCQLCSSFDTALNLTWFRVCCYASLDMQTAIVVISASAKRSG